MPRCRCSACGPMDHYLSTETVLRQRQAFEPALACSLPLSHLPPAAWHYTELWLRYSTVQKLARLCRRKNPARQVAAKAAGELSSQQDLVGSGALLVSAARSEPSWPRKRRRGSSGSVDRAGSHGTPESILYFESNSGNGGTALRPPMYLTRDTQTELTKQKRASKGRVFPRPKHPYRWPKAPGDRPRPLKRYTGRPRSWDRLSQRATLNRISINS